MMGQGRSENQNKGEGNNNSQGQNKGRGMNASKSGKGLMVQNLGTAEKNLVQSLARNTLIAILAALAIALAIAFVVSYLLTKLIERYTKLAQSIAQDEYQKIAYPRFLPREFYDLGNSLESMSNTLQENEALRRRLINDMSHELKNPLSSANLQLEAMFDGILPITKENVGQALAENKKLAVLIDDMQELSLADAKKLSLHKEKLDVAALMQELARSYENSSSEQLSFQLNLEPKIAYVYADKIRITQVIDNLLSNAFRYTEKGSIQLALKELKDQHAYELSVSDSGKGIPPEDLPYIFERFYRADSSRSNKTGGLGLGLAISKAIVEEHEGEMFAKSELGQGTVLGFYLPKYADDTAHLKN